jgi:hypothetical protein
MAFDYKTAAAIARYEPIHTETLRDFAYAARQTWDEFQLSKREISSRRREIRNLLGEIDVLKSSLLEAEAVPQPAVPDKDYKALYCELLYQVSTKHPDETRHETAMRYIRQAEDRTCGVSAAKETNNE